MSATSVFFAPEPKKNSQSGSGNMTDTTSVWGARVELALGQSTVRLNAKVWATSREQAVETIKASLAIVWPGWKVSFLTQPIELEP